MAEFDYSIEAELFPTRNRKSRRQPFGYRRFAQAADASVLQSRSYRPCLFWEPISKSTRRDMTTKAFVAYTRMPTIP
jgi:hypothetical protein